MAGNRANSRGSPKERVVGRLKDRRAIGRKKRTIRILLTSELGRLAKTGIFGGKNRLVAPMKLKCPRQCRAFSQKKSATHVPTVFRAIARHFLQKSRPMAGFCVVGRHNRLDRNDGGFAPMAISRSIRRKHLQSDRIGFFPMSMRIQESRGWQQHFFDGNQRLLFVRAVVL